VDELEGTMKRVLAVLTILCLTPGSATPGPNAGGTLIVHDVHYSYTQASGPPEYPPPGDPPLDCAGVDNSLPPAQGSDQTKRVWKVFAMFPPGSSPRLKALAFGEQIVGGLVYLHTSGSPDPVNDFFIGQNGWPSESGGGVGIVFGEVKTDLISEVFWFGGYGYAGAIWATAPHPIQQSVFGDDSFPGQTDPIAAFSSIGFGVPGTTYCPEGLPGACCMADGTCEFFSPESCLEHGGEYQGAGIPCSSNACPPPTPARVMTWGQVKGAWR
jgi:hypothetical protein